MQHAYPSHTPLAQRLRQRLWRAEQRAKHLKVKKGHAKKKTKKVQKTSPRPSDAGRPHRMCVRCRRRQDDCLREGCLPYKHPVKNPGMLRCLRKYRLGARLTARFHTDCVDVACLARWTQDALRTCGASIALLGICVHAHFNRLRTSGVLLSYFGVLLIGFYRLHSSFIIHSSFIHHSLIIHHLFIIHSSMSSSSRFEPYVAAFCTHCVWSGACRALGPLPPPPRTAPSAGSKSLILNLNF